MNDQFSMLKNQNPLKGKNKKRIKPKKKKLKHKTKQISSHMRLI